MQYSGYYNRCIADGVFYAALKMARDEEGYVWKEFFKSFKQNLKQSILIELILAAFAAILLVDINVCAKWAADGGGTLVQLLMFAAIGILIVLAAVVLYVFPVLAKFDILYLQRKECTGALHAPSATDHQHDDCYIWTDLFYNAVCRYHVYIDSVDFLY